jgi:hypothetical protein
MNETGQRVCRSSSYHRRPSFVAALVVVLIDTHSAERVTNAEQHTQPLRLRCAYRAVVTLTMRHCEDGLYGSTDPAASGIDDDVTVNNDDHTLSPHCYHCTSLTIQLNSVVVLHPSTR